VLIVVEGVDGAGKTVASKILREKLQAAHPDREVVNCRAPDGPIREVLLNRPEGTIIDHETELLLFVTCHRWLLINKVLPALARGAIVILDRFTDSTVSYQGGGRELGMMHVTKLLELHVFKPFGHSINADYRIYVEAKEEVREARLAERGNLDHMDQQGLEFRRRNQDVMNILAYQHEDHPSHAYGYTKVARFTNNFTMEALAADIDEWVSSTSSDIRSRHELIQAAGGRVLAADQMLEHFSKY
jgi:dTMP kinase